MLEKIIMPDLSSEFADTVEQLEYYSRRARLLHKIALCDRRLKSKT